MTELQAELFSLRDAAYHDFHTRLIPEIPKERVIGVRTPVLRRFAKEFAKRPQAEDFLRQLPHEYYEENNLHAELIMLKNKTIEPLLAETERFLPFIDNWATCDMFSPRLFGRHRERILEKAKEWLCREETFTVRYGVVTLMRWFLDENFSPEILQMVADVSSQEYYVNMAIAWFFSMALAKQYEVTLPLLQERRLSPWVHNKSIQKAVESRQVTPEQKEYLRSLKVKIA